MAKLKVHYNMETKKYIVRASDGTVFSKSTIVATLKELQTHLRSKKNQ